MVRPSLTNSSTPIAIVGAGLTGLSAALTLQEQQIPYRLFEGAAHPGGLATTVEEEGYRFDCTGHLLHLRTPRIREKVLGWLGPDVRLIKRNSAIWSHGVYSRYPFQANTRTLPPQVAYDCILGYLAARDARHIEGPRNFEEFCLRNFGEGFSRHFMLPYNSRLWGVPPSEISSHWCQRFVPIPTLEDVVAGAVGLQSAELGYNAEFFYPESGIGELPSALHRLLPDLELNRPLLALDPTRRELLFEHETIHYERLISTIPLPRLMDRMIAAPPAVLKASRSLRQTSLYYLDLAIGTECLKPYHWVYVPEQKYPFYRVGCYSHFSPHMAPLNASSLYVELVDRSPPDLATLLPQVAQALTEMGLLSSPESIRFARLRHIECAYVIYDQQHQLATQLVHDYLITQGITSTGRYGDWNYSSMEDALVFGEQAALRTLATL